MPASRAVPQKDANMSIEQFIDNEVKSNDVVLFMKGTPQFPQCGFSGQVVQILDHVGVGYKGLNVLESADLRNGVKTYSNWPTIPQLYVKGEFVSSATPCCSRNGTSSSCSNISRMISQPPTNSPLT